MKTRRADIERINALAELERIGWKYEPVGEDEVKCRCPAHKDDSPSCMLNVRKNLWKCHGADCQRSGDIVTFLAFAGKTERQVVLADLSSRYDVFVQKTVDQTTVENWHESLIRQDSPLKTELHKRGISDDLIRRARLGVNQGRITIPIYSESGDIINVRKYLPGAPGRDKFRNMSGMQTLALYQPEQLKYDVVWVTGGEMKALAASSFLNDLDVGAVAATAGEGAWAVEFSKKLSGKVVFVCMDVDKGGEAAALKVAKALVYYARAVYIVKLPLNRDTYPKGDVNDFIASGATKEDFVACMKNAAKFRLEELEEEVRETRSVRLIDSVKAENVGERIEVEAAITAMDSTPYLLPKEVGVSCDRSQPDLCHQCPVYVKRPDADTGKVTLKTKPTSRAMLAMINAPRKGQERSLRESLGIPECKVASFTIRTHHKVTDVRLQPQLKVTGDNSDHIVQPAYLVSDSDFEMNAPYLLKGSVHPHPKNQQAILIFDETREAQDTLTSYVPDTRLLNVFRPSAWTKEAIEERLTEFYTDLEINVTRIFNRRELHLALDLAWMSALYFNFDGRLINGWINLLVAGDSAQGKSEASDRMMDHYGVGTPFDCKNASAAGLIGGLQTLNGRWFVTWGVIPMNDRRLVILDELKGLSTDEIGQLTDMRSSGVAEITKIEKRRAHARTRLIMISNPRGNRSLSSYNFGIEAIRYLIGSLEDVRRFDLSVLLSANQIEAAEINKLQHSRPDHPHRFSSEICRQSVLWAWTRKPEQIRFEAEAACLKRATELSEKFSAAMPLIDQGTARFKIARLALALAARTFSSETGDDLIVRDCHVDYVADWIDGMYSSPVYGYADFSKAQAFQSQLKDEDTIRRQILAMRLPSEVVEGLLFCSDLTVFDIADWCNVDRDTAQKFASLLVRKHALKRLKSSYVKTEAFIEFLKKMQTEKLDHAPDTQNEAF